MTVSDFMSTDVVTVEIPGNRDDVLKILKRTGISGVPVLKEGRLVGIITRRDLLSKSEETQLGLLMTSDPVTIAVGCPGEQGRGAHAQTQYTASSRCPRRASSPA